VLAGTLHGIHAITSRLSPVGKSSGVEVIEAETFKMTIFLTATGRGLLCIILRSDALQGTKFVLLTSLTDTTADAALQRVYEAYADFVMKSPFHTPEMPIRTEKFDIKVAEVIKVFA
jgi:trafficking protein particle complex subunit 4